MSNGKKNFSTEEKFQIVKESLVSGVSISEICRHNGIYTSQYYSWQKKFLQGAKEGLKPKPRIRNGDTEKERLHELLERKNAVIAEITAENLTLKKILENKKGKTPSRTD